MLKLYFLKSKKVIDKELILYIESMFLCGFNFCLVLIFCELRNIQILMHVKKKVCYKIILSDYFFI